MHNASKSEPFKDKKASTKRILSSFSDGFSFSS